MVTSGVSGRASSSRIVMSAYTAFVQSLNHKLLLFPATQNPEREHGQAVGSSLTH